MGNWVGKRQPASHFNCLLCGENGFLFICDVLHERYNILHGKEEEENRVGGEKKEKILSK